MGKNLIKANLMGLTQFRLIIRFRSIIRFVRNSDGLDPRSFDIRSSRALGCLRLLVDQVWVESGFRSSNLELS